MPGPTYFGPCTAPITDLEPTGGSVGPQGTQRRLRQPNIAQASPEFLLMESRVNSGPISVARRPRRKTHGFTRRSVE